MIVQIVSREIAADRRRIGHLPRRLVRCVADATKMLIKNQYRESRNHRQHSALVHARSGQSLRVRRLVLKSPLAVAAALVLGCGGSGTSPAVTEARVVTDSTWAGTLGERGQLTGSGASDILNIGSGRQCATVRRTGITGFLTLRVADQSATTPAGPAGQNISVTVCGEGLLR